MPAAVSGTSAVTLNALLTLFGFPSEGKNVKAKGTITSSASRQPIELVIHQANPPGRTVIA
ncbi:hypothetical protein BTM25_08670 [Actinomadura rubteroloni]|uniref:Uncharacterized protein n=1 Tax=Actinomadura rubteroloni TaxID=1926885 RepID=A0A2P4UN38_9ACTN|nr:hypothetical protein [Actinomadura rubteroloni]POM26466.1 hypothetical protein BTM25_08670 [Actinomadura rubteroloni]